MKQPPRRVSDSDERMSQQLELRVSKMSGGERRKLDRFLINIELLGDLQRAAFKIPIRTKLLQKWLNTPEITWDFILASRDALGVDLDIVDIRQTSAKNSRPTLPDSPFLGRFDPHSKEAWLQ